MKSPNFPELIEHAGDISLAVKAGKTVEEIAVALRQLGVVTTLSRVESYSRHLAVAPELPILRNPAPSRFPDLEQVRGGIVNLIKMGYRPSEIRAVVEANSPIRTTEERISTYVAQLLDKLYPPGRIQTSLYQVSSSGQKWDDEAMVLPLDGSAHNGWTIRDFSEGVGIFGGTGSGKTSGSGLTLASELLVRGYGGLVLTTKKGEALEWVKLATGANRAADVSIIRHDGHLRLNLLQYEMERLGPGAEFTENLVEFFKNLLSVLSSGKGQAVNQDFWQLTGEQLLRNLINCFRMAGEVPTLDRLCEFVSNAPTSPKSIVQGKWSHIPVFGELLCAAREKISSADDMRVFKMLEEYWVCAYPRLAPETRSCITLAFSAMLDALRARHIYDLLSTNTTITPECAFGGRIIILDLPINEYQGAGLLVQAAWKYLFQRAVLRRPDKSQGAGCRPVFLWEDECQNFLIDFDAEFQSRARDCRVARVMMTQNVNCLYAKFGGGDAARVKVDSILGNLSTKFFHANGDASTNKYASDLIGTEHVTVCGESSTEPSYPGFNPFMDGLYRMFKKPVRTQTKGTVREPIIHPHDFVGLQTGGPRNNFEVGAIATRVGRPFADGKHYAHIRFQQAPTLRGI